MNRPWTACAVMLLTLGGTLAAVGSVNQPTRGPRIDVGTGSTAPSQLVVFCDSRVPRQFRVPDLSVVSSSYENSCGYDRSTGIHYPLPKSTQPNWPATELEMVHPSVPSFYDRDVARDYAAAQGRAWRESSEPWLPRTVRRGMPIPIIRLELRPSPSTFSWKLSEIGSNLDTVAALVRRFPVQHNTRITVLALQNRTEMWLQTWQLQDDWQRVSAYGSTYDDSAQSWGWEPSEYEELVERAIQKMPAPDKYESPRQFHPAPSRQKLLKMASSTLQQMSEMLDSAASNLDRAATGGVANRQRTPSTR
jgi:hypothetical protein